MCFIYSLHCLFTDAPFCWRKGVKFLSVVALLSYKWVTSSWLTNTWYDGSNSHILKSTQFKGDVVSFITGDVLHHVFAVVICSMPATKEWLCVWMMPVGSYVDYLLPNRFLLTDLMPLIYRRETSSAHTWKKAAHSLLFYNKNNTTNKGGFLKWNHCCNMFLISCSLFPCQHSRAQCCMLHIPSIFRKTIL